MAQKLEWLLGDSRAAVSFSTERPQEFGISPVQFLARQQWEKGNGSHLGCCTVSLPPGALSRSCLPSWELPEPGPREEPGLSVRMLGLADSLPLETACVPRRKASSQASSLSSGRLSL